MPVGAKAMPELTSTFQSTISYAVLQAEGSGQGAVDGGNILASMYQAEQSYAVYLLQQQGVSRLDILNYISHGISKVDFGEPFGGGGPDELDEDEDFESEEKRDALLARKTAKLEKKLSVLFPQLDSTAQFSWCGCCCRTGKPSFHSPCNTGFIRAQPGAES